MVQLNRRGTGSATRYARPGGSDVFHDAAGLGTPVWEHVGMSDGSVLELSSLPRRHPQVGRALLLSGPDTVFRLTRGAYRPEGPACEPVSINWVRRPGSVPPENLCKIIGWAELPNLESVVPQLAYTWNNHALAERAALLVMAILAHELEGEVIRSVIQIGGGPDYVFQGGYDVEVSGINAAKSRRTAQNKLAQKKRQLLADCCAGYVSVTTFSYPNADGPGVHSYLHFAQRSTGDPPSSRRSSPSAPKREKSMLPMIDTDGAIARASLRGDAALGTGDTTMARQHYDKAGNLLLSGQVPGTKSATKHFMLFLAATQFFKGGNYDEAARVASRIKVQMIPDKVRNLFPAFFGR